ncbi:ATP-dependent DNA helicase DDX11-like isoform X1 [Sycon ciliatum]|uniref:ATP-dependent DNA helicase DDX11-like isoform X1 n=1 Tax=Sycon ciliatum TaxID=27933 RepID=UPI0031F65590
MTSSSMQEQCVDGKRFSFPFTPYDVQLRFMSDLYRTLDEGKIGIFESPTGTGKSLSLICGALTWLKEREAAKRARLSELSQLSQASAATCREDSCCRTESQATVASDAPSTQPSTTDEFSWVLEQHDQQQKLRELHDLKNQEEQVNKVISNQQAHSHNHRKRKTNIKAELLALNSEDNQQQDALEDADLLLGDVDMLSKEKEESSDESDDEEDVHCMKIYYCSRTHTQLAQFVQEVKKTTFADDVRLVTIGSRQTLCINPDVRKLGNLSLMNDRCRELQQNKKKKASSETGTRKKKKDTTSGCPYHLQSHISQLKEQILADVEDVESVIASGRDLTACPYYASRYSIPLAELVVLPYQSLLHASSRSALNVKLAGNVVIIDEAHNLIDTLTAMHSVRITAAQLTASLAHVREYQDKYRSRLKAVNLSYLKQLIFVLEKLLACLDSKGVKAEKTSIHTMEDFLRRAHLDNVNLFKVFRYCEQSQLSRKLGGFAQRYNLQMAASVGPASTTSAATESSKTVTTVKSTAASLDPVPAGATSPLQFVVDFFKAMTNADVKGRMLITLTERPSAASLKYLLLNPCSQFMPIVQQCHAVVVAGGTMQPTSSFRQQLLYSAGITEERVSEFACDHVIPAEQLLCVTLEQGPSGVPLDLTFKSRTSPQQVDEIGRIVSNLCSLVPGGIVCFFPSYAYEQSIIDSWTKSGVMKTISNKKKVFREPKLASDVESTLSNYARCCKLTSGGEHSLTGALLFSVVGGKLSEGINFADDLGRCVIMVGLPYPSTQSVELQEKMTYLDKQQPGSGREYYEGLCMKAVNQSIGRAIRHINDYATIVLLDQRYSRPHVVQKLPNWIQASTRTCATFPLAFSAIRKFFAQRKAVSKP